MATPHVKRIKNELNKYDFYPTPYESTLSFLHAEFDGIPIPNFLEPAVGEGHIIKAIEFYSKERNEKTNCLGFDIRRDDGVVGTKGIDFLEWQDGDVMSERCIITNPPYILAQEFVEKAKQVNTTKICLFLKLQFLETLKRVSLFTDEKFPLTRIYINSSRVSCDMNKTGSIIFAWFVWEKRPLNCPPHVHFLNPKLYTEEGNKIRTNNISLF